MLLRGHAASSLHEVKAALLSPRPAPGPMANSTSIGAFACQQDICRVKIMSAITSRNINPSKHRLQAVAVKCKDIFQDLQVQLHERPAFLICVKSVVVSLRRVLRSSLHGATLDAATHKANISHKALDNMQMQLILVMCFCESDFTGEFPGSFLGQMPTRTFWHTLIVIVCCGDQYLWAGWCTRSLDPLWHNPEESPWDLLSCDL